MAEPIVSVAKEDWSLWDFGFDLNATMDGNLKNVAQTVLEEMWGGVDASLETSGLAIGCVQVAIPDNTFAYFRLTDLTRQAAQTIATNYAPQYRAEHADETRQHMAAVRDAFRAALSILDAAVEDPDRFTELGDASQDDQTSEEIISYIKQMCGG